MSDRRPAPSLREATLELHRYLSGELAPMMAVDAFEPFVASPPELAAEIIGEWIGVQAQGADVSVSDLVFHALRKLHDFASLDLVVQAQLSLYLVDVSRLLVQICPESERDVLRIRLSRIGESETVLTSRAEYLHREWMPGTDLPVPDEASSPADRARQLQGSPGVAAAPETTTAAPAGAPAVTGPALRVPGVVRAMAPQTARRATTPTAPAAPRDPKEAAAIARESKRLSVLLDRLERVRIPPGSQLPPAVDTQVLAQTLTTAALHSKTDDELGQAFDRVRKGGIDAPMGKIFRALGWNLPGWTVPSGESGEQEPLPPGRPIQAMNRIVAMAPDAQERAKRWGEMIYAAIEQLNEGRLAQAVSILEAAKRLIAEKNADATIVKQVLGQAQDAISEEVLRRLVEVPEKRGLVRKVLEFFPAFRPEALLGSLDGELRRERRKLLLAMLECHGRTCRDLVLTRLGGCLNGEPADELGYFRRNLAFLLRRIPRTKDERLDEEIFHLGSMIARTEPTISAKEAIGALGQLRRPEVEKMLVRRLRELEGQTIAGASVDEAWDLMDRLCGALARHGTKDAIRALAAHAFNRSPALGDAMSRFEHFSRLDLSADPEQLMILIDTIRSLMPQKVFGVVVKRSNHELGCLILAISGTPMEEVRHVLREISQKFHGHALGEQAQKALAKLDPKARPTATPDEALSGDLDLFGFPGLLQSLQTGGSTGELTLFDKRQMRQASIVFVAGHPVRCAAGRLSGVDALYQVLEKPFPGTFVFRSAPTPENPPEPAGGLDLMGIILEGLRRHDEYQLARALAPEGISLEPGGAAALCPEDEADVALARSVWAVASAGAPPEVCEAEVATDPFRVRRLLAAWIEQGALRPRLSALPA